jgi:hypothetical protein
MLAELDSKLAGDLVMQLTPLEHRGAVLGHMGTRPAAFVLRALEVGQPAFSVLHVCHSV